MEILKDLCIVNQLEDTRIVNILFYLIFLPHNTDIYDIMYSGIIQKGECK